MGREGVWEWEHDRWQVVIGMQSADAFIKEGLNRLRADLMQAHPKAKVGIT